MIDVTLEQIRFFRLQSHHLHCWDQAATVEELAGACGFQNSPPGAWETALRNRTAKLSRSRMRSLLEEGNLLQAWSLRGAPVVFPAAQSQVFLSALIPQGREPWIYTDGMGLALEHLNMEFEEVLDLLLQVMPALDQVVIAGKSALDHFLAERMWPLLPVAKQKAFSDPSMYGSAKGQTVGEAAVSFLLRPASFLGLVVFGAREGNNPSFTSFKNWTGAILQPGEDAVKELSRRFFTCYGPASPQSLAQWLGCSLGQATRMTKTIWDELAPVRVNGKERWILAQDQPRLLSPPAPQRRLLLLGPHDPYLGLFDREVILEEQLRQRQVWQTVANPGAIVLDGQVAGIWRARRKSGKLSVSLTLWGGSIPRADLEELCEEYAVFNNLKLEQITIEP